jgi:hypothetical protein
MFHSCYISRISLSEILFCMFYSCVPLILSHGFVVFCFCCCFCFLSDTRNTINACASENYLAISSKSVEIFWAEIYWGRHFIRAESSLIQSSCRSFIRVIVPCEISKINLRVETKIPVIFRCASIYGRAGFIL